MSPIPASYQISIRGAFDRRWVDYLGETMLDMAVQEGQICTTTFSGHPPDLAAFLGVLTLLSNWGVSVIACEYREGHPPEIEESAEPPQMISQQLR
jgi:hypothetical protein